MEKHLKVSRWRRMPAGKVVPIDEAACGEFTGEMVAGPSAVTCADCRLLMREVDDLQAFRRLPPKPVPNHRIDSDCTVVDGMCTVCGVAHGGAPCPECGGRGFHNPGCSEIDDPSARSSR